MAKVGRPEAAKETKRRLMPVYVTETERATMAAAAADEERSLSSWARRVLVAEVKRKGRRRKTG